MRKCVIAVTITGRLKKQRGSDRTTAALLVCGRERKAKPQPRSRSGSARDAMTAVHVAATVQGTRRLPSCLATMSLLPPQSDNVYSAA